MWLVILAIFIYLVARYGFGTVLLTGVTTFAIVCGIAYVCEVIIKKMAKDKKISEYNARNIFEKWLKRIAGITVVLVLLVLLIFH